MDRPDLAAQRRTIDVPAKPESGLAEWTSKIKALQRQVDEDEEAETKRLEEEIAASRLARMRRSTGRGTSTDLSKTDVAAALKESSGPTTATTDGPRSGEERRKIQDDALKRLSNDTQSRSQADYNSYMAFKNASPSTGAPMSLAAFMGGKASGPRLNKHAPQPDAHDPTTFAQRPITGPHPIFGRGGIAMPGMVGKTRGTTHENREDPAPSPVSLPYSQRDTQSRTPPAEVSRVKSVVGKVESQRISGGQQLPRSESPRQRTMSTPTGASPVRNVFPPTPVETKREQNSPRPPSWSPTTASRQPLRPTTPKDFVSHTPNQYTPIRSNTVSPLPPSPPVRSPSPPKTPTFGTPTGLAKPIQPSPRKSTQGPQINVSPNPSSAYLRPPPAKDPTPSISRLQGRGFVQNMVRVSSELETSSASGSPSSADKNRDPLRKASVLDRWQHGGEPAPVIAPKPLPLRKSRTVDSSYPSQTGSMTPVAVFPPYTPPPPKTTASEFEATTSLKPRASLPSMASHQEQSPSQKSDTANGGSTPPGKRGLGSSTTMVSYIKPLKTDDGPSATSPPSRPSSAARGRTTASDVDEHGVRARSRTRSVGATSKDAEGRRSSTPGAVVGGKPLTHPTKDRPHKPRKAKTTYQQGSKDQVQIDSASADHRANLVASPPTHVDERQFPSSLQVPDLKGSIQSSLNDDRSSGRSESPPTPGASRRVHFPLDVPPEQPVVPHVEKSPSTPSRHSRIPSTGNRATVMDVAQALTEHEQHVRMHSSDAPKSPVDEHNSSPAATPEAEDEFALRRDVKSIVGSWGSQNGVTAHPLEKRKSSYEKYAAFVLPPLAEEKTPAPSPVGTLTRNTVPPSIDTVLVPQEPLQPKPVPVPVDDHKNVVQDTHVLVDKLDKGSLPRVDVDVLLASDPSYKPNPDVQVISVEVMSIVGAVATPITRDANVFYDSEILAIVYRSKTRSSGLVNTKVWSWRGAKAQPGEREAQKLQELARRYNTSLIPIKQYAEPAELVYVLGGQLATRQGTRAHWTAENTTMLLVRSVNDLTFIDELELSIKNLCSGFSYCLSLLETFYVWHGRGSTPRERQAALAYAQSLAPSASNVVELAEDSDEEDEMFWIILGEGNYGKADYWRWKATSDPWRARIWLVDTEKHDDIVTPVDALINVDAMHEHVYVLDCVWEYFVLVGSDARGRKRDIALALDIATQMSEKLAPTRPYAPTVHVLVLPSQLPIDLRLTFRDMDELHLNKGSIPDHMNLLPATQAYEHLEKTSWERTLLQDPTMLPLGFVDAQ